MPLVLAQNDVTESGHDYADVLGESYEYPRRYASRIRTGEPFVYYRGRRTATGPPLPQAYLGIGVVGAIEDGPNGLLRCTIEDYRPFPRPLFFKSEDGYREPRANDASAVGFFFQPGVREIDVIAFATISDAGLGTSEPAPWGTVGPPAPGLSYPTAEVAAAVDAAAMTLAVIEAERRFPGAAVRRMPHNNPGFDVLVTRPDGETMHVEVKGTLSAEARFFLTEGERLFSIAHAAAYELWVFHSIDLTLGTGELVRHSGDLTTGERVKLSPVQWAGRLSC